MTATLMERADTFMTSTYARYPVVFERGAGYTLWDADGKAYTDFLAGIAVCNLGHSHPDLVAALTEQAGQLWHVSNLYYTIPQTQLAERLVGLCFAERVFFCNSGAEANEAAIKIVRKYHHDRDDDRRQRMITMDQSFHGRTMATLSATGQDKIRKGYAPYLSGFEYAPFNDLEALSAIMDNRVAAVMVEPIQGEGGVCCPDQTYLAELRSLCDDHGALLVFDEVQTGMGRTGRLFAYEHFGVTPDVMTLAKALGNGLPIGAMLAAPKVASTFDAGSHATTFGGTPLVTAVALKALELISDPAMLDHCRQMGIYLKQQLAALQEKYAVIQEIRGYGLLVGARLSQPGAGVVKTCMQRGYLINCVQDTILRFAPPLIIDKTAIDGLMDCLEDAFKDL